MSSPTDDLAGRISALEGEVARLRDRIALSTADSTAARVLAAGADREVSDMRAQLRGHMRVLQALRQTQLEQGQALAEMRAELRAEMHAGDAGLRAEMRAGDAELRAEMRAGDAGLRAEMRDGFATVHTGMRQIVALLEQIGPCPAGA